MTRADWPNVAAEGARSKGTIVRAACWRCGEEISVRVPAVEVHELNHERERAEKAEAALVLIERNCVALANDDERDVKAARRLARQIAAASKPDEEEQ